MISFRPAFVSWFRCFVELQPRSDADSGASLRRLSRVAVGQSSPKPKRAKLPSVDGRRKHGPSHSGPADPEGSPLMTFIDGRRGPAPTHAQ